MIRRVSFLSNMIRRVFCYIDFNINYAVVTVDFHSNSLEVIIKLPRVTVI
jgi:hypothetical protein